MDDNENKKFVDILSHSDDSHLDNDNQSNVESLPYGSPNEAKDKINLRKFVAAFAAMNMMGQSDATATTTPMGWSRVRGSKNRERSKERSRDLSNDQIRKSSFELQKEKNREQGKKQVKIKEDSTKDYYKNFFDSKYGRVPESNQIKINSKIEKEAIEITKQV